MKAIRYFLDLTICSPGIICGSAMVKAIHLILDFGGKTNAMQLVTATKPPHRFANLAYLSNLWMSISVLDVDPRPLVRTFPRVVSVIRNIRRSIFNEIKI